MKFQRLLSYSAILAISFFRAFADDAQPSKGPPQAIKSESCQEIKVELQQAFNLDKITKKIVEDSKRKLIASDFLSESHALLEKETKPKLAQSKETPKANAPENKAQAKPPASIRPSTPTSNGTQLAKATIPKKKT